jgi:hypothetical protein
MGRKGTGVYLHSQVYKGSPTNGKPIILTDSVNDDFIYDSSTGILKWSYTRKRNRGMEAGSLSHCHKTGKISGRRVKYNGHEIGVHRIIYQMNHGYCPDVLDHKDGNPLNNRLSNLRPADPTLNSWNQKKFRNNTSGITGVVWHKATNQWRVRLGAKGIVNELGFSDCKFEAACLRKSAELKMFGSFQRV